MTADIILLFIVFEFSMLLMGILGIPMWLKKVKPNRYYGFRTKTTLNDPEIWYEVNSIIGKQMTYWGFFLSILGLVIPFLKPNYVHPFLLIYSGILVIGLMLITANGFKISKELKDSKKIIK